MKEKTIVIIISVVVILIGGFFVLNTYIYNEKQAEYVVGDTVERSGTVLAVDTDQAALDGPVILTLEGDGGEMTTIAVPSMGLLLCPAYEANNIGDVYLMKAGDRIEVRGVVGEDGSVIPCESADHYLRSEPLIVEGFEGEADPSRMTLTMKSWQWVSAQYNDGREIVPKNPEAFNLTFEESGNFSLTTDCNGVGGRYSVGSDGLIEFSQMVQTLMYCEGSDEAEFVQLLSTATSYHFTSRGELILDLKFDSGSVVFR
jgi:heat shock protein HslJ